MHVLLCLPVAGDGDVALPEAVPRLLVVVLERCHAREGGKDGQAVSLILDIGMDVVGLHGTCQGKRIGHAFT